MCILLSCLFRSFWNDKSADIKTRISKNNCQKSNKIIKKWKKKKQLNQLKFQIAF